MIGRLAAWWRRQPPGFPSVAAIGRHQREQGARVRSTEYDVQGWTPVNPGNGEPYLNYCRDCGWAGAIATWHEDGGPFCPRCKSADMGRLVPEIAAPAFARARAARDLARALRELVNAPLPASLGPGERFWRACRNARATLSMTEPVTGVNGEQDARPR